MRKTLTMMAVGALALAAQAATDAGKNVMDVWFASVPAEAEKMLTEHKDRWNFGFRPLSKTATSWLWSDPIVQAQMLNGGGTGGSDGTAVTCCWDYEGVSILIYMIESKMGDALKKGGDFPSGSCEVYLATRSTDDPEMHPYTQFELDGALGGEMNSYPWTVYDRHVKDIASFARHRVRQLANGYLHVLTLPWEAFWNELPMKRGTENFWRFGALRWCSAGMITWGGAVHEASRFGYLRFPEFTNAERAEIRYRLLLTAWNRYRALRSQPMYRTPAAHAAPWPVDGKYLDEDRARVPETGAIYTQDAGFYPVLAKINEAREALAPKIADFKSLGPAEQEAFYEKAADMLFNYTYDVEEAYAKYATARVQAE